MRQLMSWFVQCALIAVLSNPSYACHNSNLTLNSVVDRGGSYDITVTLCVGGGITGATRGADQATRTFGFSLRRSGVTLNSFTPPSVSSLGTSVTFFGANIGPVGNSIDSDATLLYANEMQPNANFACIHSTAACGNAHTECNTYVLNVNVLPDAIDALGVEGAGNLVSGCYPDSDMRVHPATYPGVEFVRMTRIDTSTEQVTIRNFGAADVDVSGLRLAKSDGTDKDLRSMAVAGGGSLTLTPGAEVTLVYAGLLDDAGAIGLYPPGYVPANLMRDYVQWKGTTGVYESTAVRVGIWTAGTFAAGDGPVFVYTGDGSQSGAGFWSSPLPHSVPTLPTQASLALAALLMAVGYAQIARRAGKRRMS